MIFFDNTSLMMGSVFKIISYYRRYLVSKKIGAANIISLRIKFPFSGPISECHTFKVEE